jgi:hypothetical protein
MTFVNCSSLKSIHLPASLQTIDVSALPPMELSSIIVDEGSRNFSASGKFLLDGESISIIRYVGSDFEVISVMQIR